MRHGSAVKTTVATLFFLKVVSKRIQAFTTSSYIKEFHRVHDGRRSCVSRVLSTLQELETGSEGIDDPHDILSAVKASVSESKSWALDFGLERESGMGFHALFSGIRSAASMGVTGKPFILKRSEIQSALEDTNDSDPFAGFFTFDDMADAVENDFLDAIRGSTDNRKGWSVTSVSEPKGSSFEDARMTIDEVSLALEKGTVIFNTAGSHIPKLAGPTLACCDASSLPCAVNLYVTAAGKRTSAPPHTDKQDVVVVQTAGSKRWRVYTPPNPSLKIHADMFARGKGEDSLPLYSLEKGAFGCEKLLDVTLNAGDVLFIPAAFPHTTDTANEVQEGNESASLHLTFNFDTHVWDLNFLSARRYALRRAGVPDSALGKDDKDGNPYIGNVNALPVDVRNDILMNFPLDFLDENNDEVVDLVTDELKRRSLALDPKTYGEVPDSTWKETIQKIKSQGIGIFNVHREMYLAAIDEGNERKNEEAMTAHLTGEALVRARAMTPDKIQRLSLFRVQKFNEEIQSLKDSLVDWSLENLLPYDDKPENSVPDDWAFTMPLKVGDEVEADLGGAFFPAIITKVSGSHYDVKFFDGDVMNGLSRDMIKLSSPKDLYPGSESVDEEKPPEGLTKKEMKKWLKKREKKNKR